MALIKKDGAVDTAFTTSKRVLNSGLLFMYSLTLWTMFVVFYAWPTSYWYELESVYVEDSIVGMSPVMVINRSINRPFGGSFTVIVRKLDETGRSFVHCTFNGSVNYSTNALLPEDDDLDLEWWGGRACGIITEPGVYMVETNVTIELNPLIRKTVTQDSNIFEVHEITSENVERILYHPESES